VKNFKSYILATLVFSTCVNAEGLPSKIQKANDYGVCTVLAAELSYMTKTKATALAAKYADEFSLYYGTQLKGVPQKKVEQLSIGYIFEARGHFLGVLSMIKGSQGDKRARLFSSQQWTKNKCSQLLNLQS